MLESAIDFLRSKGQPTHILANKWILAKKDLDKAPDLMRSNFNYWCYRNIKVCVNNEKYSLFPTGFANGRVNYCKNINSVPMQYSSIEYSGCSIEIPDPTEINAKLKSIYGNQLR